MAMISGRFYRASIAGAVLISLSRLVLAQSVGLPAPRLLTTMPMGGRVGTELEIKITGEHLLRSTSLRQAQTRPNRQAFCGSVCCPYCQGLSCRAL